MLVLALLLLSSCAHVLDFCWALVDFILIAQYHSYNETTLEYLSQVLMRINVYKQAIQLYCHVDNNVERQFDFPKFHAITYYADNICAMGITNGFDLVHFEKYHIVILKVFYNRTNKHEFFQEQLLWHNKRRIKVLVMRNILVSLYTRDRLNSIEDSIDEVSIEATNTRPTWNHLDLNFYGKIDQSDERQCTWISKLN